MNTLRSRVLLLSFMVIIGVCSTARADPPGPFLRVAPPDTFAAQDHSFHIQFVWTASRDPDGDTVRYVFHIESRPWNNPFMWPADTVTQDTTVVVYIDMLWGPVTDYADYYWTVRATDSHDTVNASNGEGHIRLDILVVPPVLSPYPLSLSLSGYPNPFNSTAIIAYDIPSASSVELKIINLVGEVVAVLEKGNKSPGRYTAAWTPGYTASGTYFAHLVAGNQTRIQKLLLVK